MRTRSSSSFSALLSTVGALLAIGCGGSPANTDAGPDAPPVDANLTPDAGGECSTADDCDDGLFCNGTEACTAGRCVAGAVACDDSLACTLDACDEGSRRCEFTVPDADDDGYRDESCLDAAGVPLGNDCNDSDANTFPGNLETCDVADHDEDCDAATHGGTDVDGDGYESAECCNPNPAGGSPLCGEDCDDARPATNPLGTETCDSLDQDCDTRVDEGTLLDGFVDADFDGYGDSTMPADRCAAAVGFARIGGDCDDENPSANPGLPELCDVGAAVDNNCDGSTTDTPGEADWYPDADGDGFGLASGTPTRSCAPVDGAALRRTDCNDTRADINPAQAERCDGLDDNCNGVADFQVGVNDFEDDDGDGLVDIACRPMGTDCDDSNAATGPGELESCDGRDNDCDARVDEGATSIVYYRDGDADGYGSLTAGTIVACMSQVGYVVRAGDCDDADALRSPDADETCDGRDEDCDSAIDEAPAVDSCASVAHAVTSCMAGRCGIETCASGFVDCNGVAMDGCEAPVSGPAVEVCDGVDNDCDTRIDEGTTTVTFYRDLDMDGFGTTASAVTACVAPIGYAVAGGDCNDMDPTRYPGAGELCNLGDDDCDTRIDEGAATLVYYRDQDGDGYGSVGSGSMLSCTAAAGYVLNGGDCNDADALRFPTAMESCDGGDNDCDTSVDEAPAVTSCASLPNAVTGCLGGGRCGILSCNSGYRDCDTVASTGCEVHPADDVRHCGGCDTDCLGSPRVTGVVCASSRCQVTSCLPGYGDCDLFAGTGCETATTTRTNCGGCGIECQPWEDCMAGVCSSLD